MCWFCEKEKQSVRTVNSFSQSRRPSVCKCHCHHFQNGRFHSYTHHLQGWVQGGTNMARKTSLAGNKWTNLIRLKSVQRSDCGHEMHGGGPENNDRLPGTKQHLELAERQRVLRLEKLTVRNVREQRHHCVLKLIWSDNVARDQDTNMNITHTCDCWMQLQSTQL